MPYRSLKETFKASFNTEDWQNIKVPYYFPAWWTTWIIGNGFYNISLRLGESIGESYTYEQLNELSYIDLCADFLFIVNAFALLKIVEIVYNNQKDKNYKLSSENL